jgi:BMFP domain-containing protein YqiC
MSDKIFEGISAQINNVMNTFNNGADLPGQAQFRAALQSVLGKMDLVTREEFDAQAAVLARTREKVEALEKVVQSLVEQADQLKEHEEESPKA